MSERIVIIGAGQAGAQAVATLRAEGFAGSIVMVGDEPFAPYQRPPLSKAYLSGALERERLFLKPDAFYAEAKCELILGVSAKSIDRAQRCFALRWPHACLRQASDRDRLARAAHSRARRRSQGHSLSARHRRRRRDCGPHSSKGARLAVVGGGYIGLEVAAVAVKHGLDVTVFESLDRVMARAVSPQISAFYEDVHRAAGVRFLMNTGVEAFEGTGQARRHARGRRNASGRHRARRHRRRAECRARERTCGPRLHRRHRRQRFARNRRSRDLRGRRLHTPCRPRRRSRSGSNPCRTRSTRRSMPPSRWWASTRPMARCRGSGPTNTISSCRSRALAKHGDKIVLRGAPASRKFAAFHLREGRVAAVEAVNAAPEYIVGRKLIADRAHVAPERLADTTIPMKNIV
jgi:3-phenylpropionate/trans-cinnamate dioxygenase ferredoxin reductase subunit